MKMREKMRQATRWEESVRHKSFLGDKVVWDDVNKKKEENLYKKLSG